MRGIECVSLYIAVVFLYNSYSQEISILAKEVAEGKSQVNRNTHPVIPLSRNELLASWKKIQISCSLGQGAISCTISFTFRAPVLKNFRTCVGKWIGNCALSYFRKGGVFQEKYRGHDLPCSCPVSGNLIFRPESYCMRDWVTSLAYFTWSNNYEAPIMYVLMVSV